MIGRLSNIIKAMNAHPLSGGTIANAKRFLSWQVASRLVKAPIIFPWVDDAVLAAGSGETGITGNFYSGLLEFDDMGFLLHYLRADDLFVDVGANAGVYSVLASKCCGSRTIACEPVSETFNRLGLQIRLNDVMDKVETLQSCVGAEPGYLYMSNTLDTMNAVTSENASGTERVEVTTLDDVLSAHREKTGKCVLKIDVEGFEMSVLDGGQKSLSDKIDAIVIEINGAAQQFGHSDDDIHDRVVGFGFEPYEYDPLSRKLKKASSFDDGGNTIYIRDGGTAEAICKAAKKFLVHSANGRSI